jgi:hypothetical protein
MNKRILSVMLGMVLAGLLSVMLWGRVQHTAAAADRPAQICQSYRVAAGVSEVRFRSCPDEGCAVVGGATRQDAICVLGFAEENTNWLMVNPTPDDAQAEPAYVLASLVEPGVPGEADPNAYCNAYTPVSGSVVVRAEPALNAPPLGDIAEGDTVCIDQYAGGFIYWLGVQGSGFIDIQGVTPYTGEVECDGWQVTAPTLDVHSCASFRCDVVNTLQRGDIVCVDREQGEDIDWIGFRYAGTPRTGWVYAPLMEEIPEAQQIGRAHV